MQRTLTLFRIALLFCLPVGAFAQIAVHLDGTNDWIATNQPAITGSASRTLECWIKVPTSAPATQLVILDMGSTATGARFTLNILSNKLRVEVAGNGFNGVTNVNDGVWHHVALTYNPSNSTGKKAKIYLDGVLEAQADFTVTVNTASGNIRIGARVDGLNYLMGSIDEVRVWNTERTLTEINTYKSTQFCTKPSGLIAFYKFNEGTAAGTNTSITSVANWANSSYSGTLTNFARSGSSSNFVAGAPVTEVAPSASSISPVACASYTSPASHVYTATGIYRDTLINSVGCDSVITINLTINTIPPAPVSMTGNTSVCPNSTQSYSVSAVPGATSYVWTLPSGWSGSSTTNSISVTPGTAGGTLSVAAVNGCGTSLSYSLAVAITSQLPAQPGTIIGSAMICAGATQTYIVPAVPNAVTYNWTLPSGWTGTSTSNSIVVTATGSGGTLAVTANNGCGNGPSSTLTLGVSPLVVPSVTISTSSTSPCAGAPVTFVATAVNGGLTPGLVWNQNGNPIGGPNSSSFTASNLKNNDVISVTLISNAACPTTSAVNSNSIKMTIIPITVPGINVNASTSPTICSGTQVTFAANITGGGTTPQYQWMLNTTPVGTNSSFYTVSGLNDNDSVYCILNSSSTCSTPQAANSNRITFQVMPLIMPQASVSASPGNIVEPGQTVTFTANMSGEGSNPDLQWMKNGKEIPGETAAMYTTNSLKNGDQISVRLLSSEECANPALVTSVPVAMQMHKTGIAGNTTVPVQVVLAPNPNKGQFEIQVTSATLDRTETLLIAITDVVGRKIYEERRRMPFPGEKIALSLADNATSGIYFVRLQTATWSDVQKMELHR